MPNTDITTTLTTAAATTTTETTTEETTEDHSQITATCQTATLTVPVSVVETHSDDALDQHVRRLLGTLLATHDSQHVTCGLPAGDVTLRAGEAFAETPLGEIRIHVSELVESVLETYFHVALDAGAPEHYQGINADEPVAATDGGRR